MYDSDGKEMNRKQAIKYLFDREQDGVTLERVLHAEWVVLPSRSEYDTGYRDRLTIAVRHKGGGFHNIAWFPFGFPYGVVESLVEERNKHLQEGAV